MLEISNIGIVTAFAAGVVSFVSPCVLPLVPGYVSYIAGHSTDGSRGRAGWAVRLPIVALSLCFVLGFSTIFILLGASATTVGNFLLAYRYELNIAGGIIIVAFGLFLLGAIKPSWFVRDWRFYGSLPGGSPVSAYILGLAFAFGWTPCIGPILGAILTVGAASATVSGGVALLAIYSLGLGVPFLLAAMFTDGLAARLKSIGRVGRILQLVAGGIIVLMGIAMITGYLSTFSYWMLDAFPILGRIG